MKRFWFWILNFMSGVILFYNLFTIEVNIQYENPFELDGDYITFSIRDTSKKNLSDNIAVYMKEFIERNEEVFIAIVNRDLFTTEIYDGCAERGRKDEIAIKQWLGDYTVAYLETEEMTVLEEGLAKFEISDYKVHKRNGRFAEMFKIMSNNRNFKNMLLGTLVVYWVYVNSVKLAINNEAKSLAVLFLCGANKKKCISMMIQKSFWGAFVPVLIAGKVTYELFSYALKGENTILIFVGSVFIVFIHEIIFIMVGLSKFTEIMKSDWSIVY